ncbi:MAG: BlaI/MecI/CopY family transcriptional regulator [Clostridia bacterium]|nr:BlaI/MecI/CopY family transcriptional regulator [Clostridia bacterium]
MSEYQMGEIESRFADIIWDNQPISSTELAKRAEESFGWKKSTTYTVLKRLCDKGIFVNEKGNVSPLISRDEFYSMQSERFVMQTFKGSLPAFLTAFIKRKSLTPEEVEHLRRIVAEYEEE